MVSSLLRYPKSLQSYNPIPGGCVLYFPLWNPGLHGTTFKSIEPFGHDCTRVGGVMDGDGFTGDGNDYINLDNVLPSLASSTVGSWLAWVKLPDVTPTTTTIFITFGDTDANYSIQFGQGSDGFLRALCNDNANTWFVDSDGQVINDNEWALVGLVQDGTEPVLYVNNAKPAQTFIWTIDKTIWFSDLGSLDNGRIGCRSYNGGGNEQFLIGSMGEAWIYDRVLSLVEFTHIYNQTRGNY